MSGSLALLEDDSVIAEWTIRSARTHNRRLLAAIDMLLQNAGWGFDTLDGFAVSSGPGSFTGLRIGMTTIKVLAWTRGKLYAGIPSLDALAHPLSFSELPVCTIMDARRNEVYWALYRSDSRGKLKLVVPYSAISPSALVKYVTEPVIFCGDGWQAYKDQIRETLGPLAVEASPFFHQIRACSVGELARRRFMLGQTDDPTTSTPVYIRPSEAEIRYPELAEKSSAIPEII